MVKISLKCPECASENIIKADKSTSKKQRYKCKDCNKPFQDAIIQRL